MKDTFWQTIDEWSTGTDESAMFHQYVPNHEDMLAECIAYNYWESDIYGIGKDRTRTEDEKRLFALPNPKDFPKLYQFLQENSHQYFSPQISLLKSGGQILPHNHKDSKRDEKWLFNMSLNFPAECKFAVYPTGIVPYRAADVYKLRVENFHSVINESDTDRYHIMMRTKETVQSWGVL